MRKAVKVFSSALSDEFAFMAIASHRRPNRVLQPIFLETAPPPAAPRREARSDAGGRRGCMRFARPLGGGLPGTSPGEAQESGQEAFEVRMYADTTRSAALALGVAANTYSM